MIKKYNLIDTVEKLKELDNTLMDGDIPRYEVLAVDTETNGLLLYRSTIVGFSISFDNKSGFYIPLLKWVPNTDSFKSRKIDKHPYNSYMGGHLECMWTGEKFDEFVKPQDYNISERFPLIPALAKRWFSNSKLFMWNAPFDVNMFFSNFKIEGEPLDLKNNLFLDGSLMAHIINENESVALKPTAERYKDKLGINPHAMAAQEKKELTESIRINGGSKIEVWRADLDTQSKYACADTFLTYGLCEVLLDEFYSEFGDSGIKWFFDQEVMPVCKEVVIGMKRRGVYIDVPYFERLYKETADKLNSLEDELIQYFNDNGYLKGFDIGKTLEEAVSGQRLIKEIIMLENLTIPKKFDAKTNTWKETLAKSEVKKQNDKEVHWVWGYILGEDELRYSDKKLAELRSRLYAESEGRRYRFNIRSDDHLRWLICDKLGFDRKTLPQTDSATKEKHIPSMKAQVLEDYVLPKHPWIKKLLLFKKLQKLQSSYISNAVNLHVDGWLYMDMKQNGTKSGRFSCSGGFNLQTLPKVEEIDSCPNCKAKNPKVEHRLLLLATLTCEKCGHIEQDVLCSSAIKAGFIAPPGYKILNADYSSLEPRCFAYMSGDDKIKAVYKQNLDLYSQIYCTMFPDGKNFSPDPESPKFLKKLAPEKRTMVKPIVLGIPYGASSFQVAALCGYTKEFRDQKTGAIKIIPDTERGEILRSLYLDTFVDLHKYMQQQEIKAVKEGSVSTIVGRRRHFLYAKRINTILAKHGIDYRDITNASPSELKKDLDISFVSLRGVKVSLNRAMLTDIKDALKLQWDKILPKGGWLYIRNLLKADINEACNNPIQGLAAHITNKGMLDTTRLYKYNKLDAWVFLQVHDEISSYVREDQAEAAVALKKHGMEENEFAHLIDIKMVADPIICGSLKESK